MFPTGRDGFGLYTHNFRRVALSLWMQQLLLERTAAETLSSAINHARLVAGGEPCSQAPAPHAPPAATSLE